ncbi:hypothetical protein CC86DRAFT_369684 [Ophiobolus disseminans]|uniref:Uncharacterized protein n=1 Tax=Ophiobolus disseminans TaxID=1469910 RepID=A0A6A7A470_9PLEO|nr:hypothetical protein CC86DRAFT_369684 [Ophiobolus disseminans]
MVTTLDVVPVHYGAIKAQDIESQNEARQGACVDIFLQVCKYFGVLVLLGICYGIGLELWLFYLIQKCGFADTC